MAHRHRCTMAVARLTMAVLRLDQTAVPHLVITVATRARRPGIQLTSTRLETTSKRISTKTGTISHRRPISIQQRLATRLKHPRVITVRSHQDRRSTMPLIHHLRPIRRQWTAINTICLTLKYLRQVAISPRPTRPPHSTTTYTHRPHRVLASTSRRKRLAPART